MDSEHDVLGVLGRPDTSGTVQCQIKRVLADYPDRCHGNLDAGATIVAVHHHHVRCDLVPCNDVAVGHPGQHPDLAPSL